MDETRSENAWGNALGPKKGYKFSKLSRKGNFEHLLNHFWVPDHFPQKCQNIVDPFVERFLL